MIVSVHLADVGRYSGLRLLRSKLDPAKTPGLRHAEMTIAAPLGERLLPRPNPSRVGLIAAWDEDGSLDAFLTGHPLARELARGWRVRLRPTRIFGAWPQVPGLPTAEEPMNDAEPAVVLTIGRLRLSQTMRFLRASAAAERLAVGEPALLAATGLARPPNLVATFSVWGSTGAMRAYAQGKRDDAHLAAVRAHAARPFHSEAAFVRFRPYRSEGSWNGRDPLA